MKEKKFKVIKYLRLSDADIKPGESDSITNQRRLIDEYIKKHPEFEVVGERIDDGKTGINYDRPALTEMMQEFVQGKANCCITKDLSRLGREFSQTLIVLRETFPEYGIRFIAINDNIDTLFDSGEDLTITVRTAMNDEYSRDISNKTRSSLTAKRKNGEYVGAFPIYGYKKSEENRNLLVIDEYSADIVRQIFNMRIGGLSAVRIADDLNSKGVLSPHLYKKANGLPHPSVGLTAREDAKWSAKTILRILNNETYTGTLIQGITSTPNYKVKEVIVKPVEERIRVENTHEAIVSKHTFDLTQKLLMLDTRTAPNGESVYALSGLLICGYCGSRLHRRSVHYNGVITYYYHCKMPKKHGCHSSVMIREDYLTEYVLNYIKNYVSNVASIEKVVANIDADQLKRGLAKNLTLQLSEKEGLLEKTRLFLGGINEEMSANKLTKSQYKILKAQYKDDETSLLMEIKQLEHEIEVALSCNEERTAWIGILKEFDNLEELDRRTVVNFIQSIKVNSKTDLVIALNHEAEYEMILEIMRETKSK